MGEGTEGEEEMNTGFTYSVVPGRPEIVFSRRQLEVPVRRNGDSFLLR